MRFYDALHAGVTPAERAGACVAEEVNRSDIRLQRGGRQ